MTAPKTVKVLGKTYSVQFVEKVDEKDSYGEHEISEQLIKVRLRQHPESARETLLHEVIHAVEDQMNLSMKEAQVHGLAVGLFQVLCENPEFVTFLTQTKRRGK